MPQRTKCARLFVNAQWQQCFEDFLRSLGNKSGSRETPYLYERALRRFFSNPHRSPDTYTRAEVEAYLHAPTTGHRGTGEPPKPDTYNARLTRIRSFYTYATTYSVPFRGKLRPLMRGVSPTSGIDLAQTAPQTNRTLTLDMIERIFAVVPKNTVKGLRDRALFLGYFWTGRRRAEIISMRWQDIEQQVRFDDGHVGTLYHWRGKGRSRMEDRAELPVPAWEAICTYLKAAGRWEHMQASDPVFVRVHDHAGTQKPLNPDSINRVFREYLDKAGIDNDHGRISLHSWRHSAAFVRYQEKQDPALLQKFLRHKNVSTTIRYIEEWTRQPDTSATVLTAKYGHL